MAADCLQTQPYRIGAEFRRTLTSEESGESCDSETAK